MLRLALAICVSLAFGQSATATPQEPQDSQFVKLLKSGRVPEERVGTILDLIGRRGTTADLTYVYHRTLEPEGFGPEGRRIALAALTEAALTRQARPEGDLSGLVALIRGEAEVDEQARLSAIRLAGAWRLDAAGAELRRLAEAPGTPRILRTSAVGALAAVGGAEGAEALEKLAGADRPWEVRALAVAALARLDLETALSRALEVLAETPPDADLTTFLAAFLNLRGGADRLARAIEERGLKADAAKLALRGMYAQGRTDAPLVAALSKAAGLDAEVEPLDEAAMRQLVAEVAEKGDPARGEAVFRRPDLNCVQCHALAGAGGGVGPDLSAVGTSSPYDYLINSILLPDQAIKEEYQTRVIFTEDGQVFQGILADRDNRRVILRQATGELRTIPADAIEETQEGGSLMPKGLANLMTRQELMDVVSFLGELGKPGPYAIRSLPTIQRWRVLREPDVEALVQNVPNPETLRSMVLDAPEERWSPAYGLVSGDLSLEEAARIAGGPVVYLLGEIDVSVPGQLHFRLDSAEGVRAWVDGEPVGEGEEFDHNVTSTGRHSLVLRVDTRKRNSPVLRAEVQRRGGSIVQFTVVGGR